jgi:hypothetical protein
MRTVDIDAVHPSQQAQEAEEEAKHRGYHIRRLTHQPGWCSRQFHYETCHTWLTGASCPGNESAAPRAALRQRSYW